MPAVHPLSRKPISFGSFSSLVAAESTRHGGVSSAPFNSLNLGLNTADSPENVQENRRRFFTSLGIDPARIVSAHQVHGNQILLATQPGHYEGYDAFITNQPNLYMTVTVADCTPILIYDAQQQAVAAIHAGWRGTIAQLAEKTVGVLQTQFGTNPADCHAYIGTCIDECSFEVGAEVADQFDPAFRQFDEGRKKYLVNLKAANQRQLLTAGIPADQIEVSPYSSVLHNEDYFSYRYEQGNTGRMVAVIGWQ